LRLLDAGFSLNEVGRTLRVASSPVMRWRDVRKTGGEEALKVQFSPGRPAPLTSRQSLKIE
jgi:hypothetical protein